MQNLVDSAQNLIKNLSNQSVSQFSKDLSQLFLNKIDQLNLISSLLQKNNQFINQSLSKYFDHQYYYKKISVVTELIDRHATPMQDKFGSFLIDKQPEKTKNRIYAKFEQIKNEYIQIKKTAFFPIVKKTFQSRTNILGNKFSGLPYIKEKEKYPSCQNCQKPMTSIIQLNFEHLQHLNHEQNYFKFPDQGLVQLFLCTQSCGIHKGTFIPKSGFLCRYIKQLPQQAKNYCEDIDFFQNIKYPQFDIVGWQKFPDYPTIQEADDLNIKSINVMEEPFVDDGKPIQLIEDRALDLLIRYNYTAAEGDKLLGYAEFIQQKQLYDFPKCKKCKKQKKLLFQLSAGSESQFDFQDENLQGNGFIIICNDHPQEVQFVWNDEFKLDLKDKEDTLENVPPFNAKEVFKKVLIDDPEFMKTVGDDVYCCKECDKYLKSYYVKDQKRKFKELHELLRQERESKKQKVAKTLATLKKKKELKSQQQIVE